MLRLYLTAPAEKESTMTEAEAEARLTQLHVQKCTCGEPSLLVIHHDSKTCSYRMAAWTPLDLRPFAGDLYLYSVADAESEEEG